MSYSNILGPSTIYWYGGAFYIFLFYSVLYIEIYGTIMHPLIGCLNQSLDISVLPFFEMSGSAVFDSFQMYRMVKKNRYFS